MATEVTVVVPAYQASATLPSVLRALAPQMHAGCEAIVVDSSNDGQAEKLAEEFPWVRWILPTERTLPGAARNLGVANARGSAIAFLDADALPAPAWLRNLVARSDGVDGVAGAVLNGTPRNAIGTASWLLEFSEWHPGRRGRPDHAASCNLLVSRDALDRAGGFPEDLWPGEDTVLTYPWGRDGRLAFRPDAVVHHVNRTGGAEFLRHQRRLGLAFAAVCDRVDFPHARFSNWPWLAGAPALRLAALVRRIGPRPRLAVQALVLLPVLLAGLAAWGAGVAAARR